MTDTSFQPKPKDLVCPPPNAKFTSVNNIHMANWELSGWHVSVYYGPTSADPDNVKIENWDYAQVSDGKAKYICYTRDTSTGVITEKHINAFPLWYGN
jgi:hypothetical protein